MARRDSDKPLVLVVDDEDHITELVAMALGYNGFDVIRKGTGRAGLEAVEKHRPDLVVLDVMMPDLDGFMVAKRIRQDEGVGRHVPIIFLTREQILEHVWDYTFEAKASVLDTYVSYLRRRIDAHGPPLIHTVRGIGYTFRQSSE